VEFLPNQVHLDVAHMAFEEGRLAISQIKGEAPSASLVKTDDADGPVRCEILRPPVKRRRVVLANVIETVQAKRAASRNCVEESGDGGDATTREDARTNEVSLQLGTLETSIRDYDRLQQHLASRIEKSVERSEKCSMPAPIHRLDHLDRNDLGISTSEVAPVERQHFDQTPEFGLLDELSRDGQLRR
jgi:hypothetical protein